MSDTPDTPDTPGRPDTPTRPAERRATATSPPPR